MFSESSIGVPAMLPRTLQSRQVRELFAKATLQVILSLSKKTSLRYVQTLDMGRGKGAPISRPFRKLSTEAAPSLSLWYNPPRKAAFAEEGQCLCDLTRATSGWKEEGMEGGREASDALST